MKTEIENENLNALLNLEVKAMERWGKGDPSGFLEISDQDVVYFDPFTEARIDGLENLTQYYENIRGQIFIDHFDILNPNIIGSGNVYVFTYNFVSFTKNIENKWNCTEVYRKTKSEWKIIHSHWSFTTAK